MNVIPEEPQPTEEEEDRNACVMIMGQENIRVRVYGEMMESK